MGTIRSGAGVGTTFSSVTGRASAWQFLAVLVGLVLLAPPSSAGQGGPGPQGPGPQPPSWDDPVCPTPGDVPSPFPPALPREPTAAVGALTGTLETSPYGDAVYSLPLVVPPGHPLATPQLTLRYESGGPSGTLGIGFDISGLSSIARCPRTYAQDGYQRRIGDDADDAYCLDGRRLVEVATGDDPKGQVVEYRTFPDTFARVKSFTPPGAPSPTSFQVEAASGQVLDYGNTTAGRVMGRNGVVRAWWLTRSRDRSDNRLNVSYVTDVDPVDGHTRQHAPTRISYGGNAEGLHTLAVSFEYGEKPAWDRRTLWSRGLAVESSWLLNRVRMLGPGDALVREYRFDYDEKASDQRRTRLRSVEECGCGWCVSAEDDLRVEPRVGRAGVRTTNHGRAHAQLEQLP